MQQSETQLAKCGAQIYLVVLDLALMLCSMQVVVLRFGIETDLECMRMDDVVRASRCPHH